jgi:hypothetical protein
MLAEVNAGSRLFPIADKRLKDNFFAHSIVCDTVTVDIAILSSLLAHTDSCLGFLSMNVSCKITYKPFVF